MSHNDHQSPQLHHPQQMKCNFAIKPIFTVAVRLYLTEGIIIMEIRINAKTNDMVHTGMKSDLLIYYVN